MKTLLELGADANAAAGDDMTSLHFAAQKGHTEVCRLLLGSGEHSLTKTSDRGHDDVDLRKRGSSEALKTQTALWVLKLRTAAHHTSVALETHASKRVMTYLSSPQSSCAQRAHRLSNASCRGESCRQDPQRNECAAPRHTGGCVPSPSRICRAPPCHAIWPHAYAVCVV